MENMEAVESVDKIKTRVVGIDIRIEKTTIALVDIRGDIVAQDYFPTSDYPDVNDYLTALSENIFALLEENGGYESVRSIGVSAPSASYITGCIENAANLPWKGVIPLAAMLRDRLGLAVAVANDAHITALGERTYGSAHGMKDFVVVTISHGGLGSCFFSNGQPHLGNDGFAGEIGHTCVEINGRECGCGKRGCLETYCSQLSGDLLFSERIGENRPGVNGGNQRTHLAERSSRTHHRGYSPVLRQGRQTGYRSLPQGRRDAGSWLGQLCLCGES